MYPYMAEVTAFASNSPLAVAQGLEKFFDKYPHGCSEQLTSRVFPFLALAPLDGKGVLKRADTQSAFNSAVSVLRGRQLNGGGFAMWDGGIYEDKEISIYIAHFLTEAKELGYNTPAEMLDNALRKMDDYAAKYPSSASEAFSAVKAAYVLARNGRVITKYLARAEEYLDKNQKDWRNTMTGVYLASSYKLLKDDAKANGILSAFKPDAAAKYVFYSDFDSSSIRNAEYMYLMGKHFPERVAGGAGIIEGLIEDVANNKYNTMSAAYTVMALAAYGGATEEKDASLKMFDDTLKDAPKEMARLSKAGIPQFDIKDTTESARLESGETGPLGVFFIISSQGFDKVAPAQAQAKGLEITREYKNAEGKAVASAQTGDDLTVSIKIRATAKDAVTNVAVTDLLPGAFEAVAGSVKGNADFYDLREDRALIYLTATKDIREITYKVKVIAAGEFTAPAACAASLYDTDTSGCAKAGKFSVTPAK
jgi:uncharacterized repeat protein (TIGR01451 family)